MLTFAGYTLYNSALAKLPTTMVAISGYGQPVIATGLALLLLGEVPSLTGLIGGSIVVAGLAIATLGQNSAASRPRERRNPSPANCRNSAIDRSRGWPYSRSACRRTEIVRRTPSGRRLLSAALMSFRARCSLVFTVSGLIMSSAAVSSMLISSMSRRMRTILKGSGRPSMACSSRSRTCERASSASGTFRAIVRSET